MDGGRARGRGRRRRGGAGPAAPERRPRPPPTGSFSSPFAEPTINGVRTDMKCIRRAPRPGLEPTGPLYSPYWDCKPAAVSSNVTPLPGRIVYWNGLEGTENINAAIAGEFGTAAVNDQSRALDLNAVRPVRLALEPAQPGRRRRRPAARGQPRQGVRGRPQRVGRRARPGVQRRRDVLRRQQLPARRPRADGRRHDLQERPAHRRARSGLHARAARAAGLPRRAGLQPADQQVDRRPRR